MARPVPEDSGAALFLPLDGLYFSFGRAEGAAAAAKIISAKSNI
jgi:hypothetical protein